MDCCKVAPRKSKANSGRNQGKRHIKMALFQAMLLVLVQVRSTQCSYMSSFTARSIPHTSLSIFNWRYKIFVITPVVLVGFSPQVSSTNEVPTFTGTDAQSNSQSSLSSLFSSTSSSSSSSSSSSLPAQSQKKSSEENSYQSEMAQQISSGMAIVHRTPAGSVTFNSSSSVSSASNKNVGRPDGEEVSIASSPKLNFFDTIAKNRSSASFSVLNDATYSAKDDATYSGLKDDTYSDFSGRNDASRSLRHAELPVERSATDCDKDSDPLSAQCHHETPNEPRMAASGYRPTSQQKGKPPFHQFNTKALRII